MSAKTKHFRRSANNQPSILGRTRAVRSFIHKYRADNPQPYHHQSNSERMMMKRRKQMLEGKLGADARQAALDSINSHLPTFEQGTSDPYYFHTGSEIWGIFCDKYIKGELTNALQTVRLNEENSQGEHREETGTMGGGGELGAGLHAG